ncbi:MAG TPA: helix-turn-helix transcriptional regulator [Bryobacteraceae bacterium]|nr:helix-turn-helix transcriptional regulator [Bryobacteraceae bacterium]
MRHVAKEQDVRPLSEPVLLILLTLAEHPRHGYALMKDIEEVSEGRVRLSTGTLYGAIRRLLDDGWIERYQQQDTSRDKQAYRLSPIGRRQLESELDRMRQLTRVAGERLRMSEVTK